MRIFAKLLTTIFLLFVLTTITHGQAWMESIHSADPTFKEITDDFNEYWKNKTPEKGQGYKPFRRWEWYWQRRLMPDGHLPKPSITWNEWNKYVQAHPETNHKPLSTTGT